MAQLNAASWAVVAQHIDELLALPVPERVRRIDELAANEPDTAGQLQALMQARDAASRASFLGGVAYEPLLEPKVGAGDVLGAWTLVDLIGQGGMGSVWRACRSDGRFEGEAAVKLLSTGLFDAAAQERFRREGAILARLHHPGIAQLMDAGVSGRGQPYLVLELVHGQRIDQWAAASQLGLRATLTLFLQVLDAMAVAHRQLVIHRDVKPSNILVNAAGQVKLLDFGIASLMGDEAGPELTREGTLALTPEYAAPEQFNGGVLSMATDVYGLGVVLFELLTATHPSGLKNGAPFEYLRAASEGTFKPASERAPALRRALRGDLDNILAKALRPVPGERYDSVSAFAADLRRHLRHEPVSARPDALAYRAGRFFQRHPVGVAGSALLALAIAAGTGGTLAESRRAESESALARAERIKALEAAAESNNQRRIAQQQSDMAKSAAQRAGELADAAQVAASNARSERERAERMLARSMNAEHFNNDLLMHAANAGRALDFNALLEQGEFLATRDSSNPEYQASALLTLVEFYNSTGDGAKGAELANRAVRSADAAHDRSLALQARCAQGRSLVIDEKIPTGQALMQKALDLAGNDAQVQTYCLESLADVAMRRREGERMLDYANRAFAASKSIPVHTPTQTASLLTSIADAHRLLHHEREAEKNYAAAFDALNRAGVGDGWEAADLLTNWAADVSGSGQQLRALSLTERAIAIARTNGGVDNLNPSLLLTWSRTLTAVNRLDEAWSAAERARARALAVGNHQVQALTEQVFSRIRTLQGLFPEAWQHADKFSELVGAVPPNSFPALAVQFARARIQQAEGRFSDALQTLEKVHQQLDELTAKQGRNHGVLPMIWQNWLELHAELLGATGHAVDGLPEVREAIKIAKTLQGSAEASADTGTSLLVLAQLQLVTSNRSVASVSAAEAASMLAAALGPEHPKTAQARSLLQLAAVP